MSFWKKIVGFFAEADSPEEAVRTFVDASKSEDTRRAQIAIVESLSDRLPSGEEASKAKAREAFGALCGALSDPAPWVRATATRGLRELAGLFRYDLDPSVVTAAVVRLLPCVADPDAAVRAGAASALSNLCDVVDEDTKLRIANSIRPLCDDADAKTRAAGAIHLGSCGEAARPHLPRIVAMLDDADPGARGNAASALWMIGVPDANRALVSKLVGMLQSDPVAQVRSDVANALGKLGGAYLDAVLPALVRATEDGEKDVRHFAIFAISDFGPSGAPAVPRLGQMLSVEEHREAAAIALRSVANENAQALLAQHGLPPE
jgi:HEAT repeat protein